MQWGFCHPLRPLCTSEKRKSGLKQSKNEVSWHPPPHSTLSPPYSYNITLHTPLYTNIPLSISLPCSSPLFCTKTCFLLMPKHSDHGLQLRETQNILDVFHKLDTPNYRFKLSCCHWFWFSFSFLHGVKMLYGVLQSKQWIIAFYLQNH